VTDLTKLEEQIAREMVAPVILKLLKPFSASEMTLAIKNKINLAKELENDPEYLNQLRHLVIGIPFADKIAQKCKRKKWIMWFINNEMKHKRSDLYTQVIYSPKGVKYVDGQVKKIVKTIFG